MSCSPASRKRPIPPIVLPARLGLGLDLDPFAGQRSPESVDPTVLFAHDLIPGGPPCCPNVSVGMLIVVPSGTRVPDCFAPYDGAGMFVAFPSSCATIATALAALYELDPVQAAAAAYDHLKDDVLRSEGTTSAESPFVVTPDGSPSPLADILGRVRFMAISTLQEGASPSAAMRAPQSPQNVDVAPSVWHGGAYLETTRVLARACMSTQRIGGYVSIVVSGADAFGTAERARMRACFGSSLPSPGDAISSEQVRSIAASLRRGHFEGVWIVSVRSGGEPLRDVVASMPVSSGHHPRVNWDPMLLVRPGPRENVPGALISRHVDGAMIGGHTQSVGIVFAPLGDAPPAPGVLEGARDVLEAAVREAGASGCSVIVASLLEAGSSAPLALAMSQLLSTPHVIPGSALSPFVAFGDILLVAGGVVLAPPVSGSTVLNLCSCWRGGVGKRPSAAAWLALNIRGFCALAGPRSVDNPVESGFLKALSALAAGVGIWSATELAAAAVAAIRCYGDAAAGVLEGLAAETCARSGWTNRVLVPADVAQACASDLECGESVVATLEGPVRQRLVSSVSELLNSTDSWAGVAGWALSASELLLSRLVPTDPRGVIPGAQARTRGSVSYTPRTGLVSIIESSGPCAVSMPHDWVDAVPGGAGLGGAAIDLTPRLGVEGDIATCSLVVLPARAPPERLFGVTNLDSHTPGALLLINAVAVLGTAAGMPDVRGLIMLARAVEQGVGLFQEHLEDIGTVIEDPDAYVREQQLTAQLAVFGDLLAVEPRCCDGGPPGRIPRVVSDAAIATCLAEWGRWLDALGRDAVSERDAAFARLCDYADAYEAVVRIATPFLSKTPDREDVPFTRAALVQMRRLVIAADGRRVQAPGAGLHPKLSGRSALPHLLSVTRTRIAAWSASLTEQWNTASAAHRALSNSLRGGGIPRIVLRVHNAVPCVGPLILGIHHVAYHVQGPVSMAMFSDAFHFFEAERRTGTIAWPRALAADGDAALYGAMELDGSGGLLSRVFAEMEVLLFAQRRAGADVVAKRAENIATMQHARAAIPAWEASEALFAQAGALRAATALACASPAAAFGALGIPAGTKFMAGEGRLEGVWAILPSELPPACAAPFNFGRHAVRALLAAGGPPPDELRALAPNAACVLLSKFDASGDPAEWASLRVPAPFPRAVSSVPSAAEIVWSVAHDSAPMCGIAVASGGPFLAYACAPFVHLLSGSCAPRVSGLMDGIFRELRAALGPDGGLGPGVTYEGLEADYAGRLRLRCGAARAEAALGDAPLLGAVRCALRRFREAYFALQDVTQRVTPLEVLDARVRAASVIAGNVLGFLRNGLRNTEPCAPTLLRAVMCDVGPTEMSIAAPSAADETEEAGALYDASTGRIAEAAFASGVPSTHPALGVSRSVGVLACVGRLAGVAELLSEVVRPLRDEGATSGEALAGCGIGSGALAMHVKGGISLALLGPDVHGFVLPDDDAAAAGKCVPMRVWAGTAGTVLSGRGVVCAFAVRFDARARLNVAAAVETLAGLARSHASSVKCEISYGPPAPEQLLAGLGALGTALRFCFLYRV